MKNRLVRAGLLTKLVILTLLIYLVITLLNLRTQLQLSQQHLTTLTQQVAQQQLENDRLAEAVENSDDPDILDQVARDRGYVKQDELLIFDVAN